LSLDTDDPKYLLQAVDEHEAMVLAVIDSDSDSDSDSDAITKLIATHIRSTADVLLSNLDAAYG
jgi:hypothetical protein